MKHFTCILVLAVLFSSCDDGDIITVDLDFPETFKACGTDNLILYTTKTDPPETFSIELANTTLESLLETEYVDDDSLLVQLVESEKTFIIDGTTNRLIYRRYNTMPNQPFCNDVPPSELDIKEDFESDSGQINILIRLIEDDNDDIPRDFEDLNGNGDLYDDDTDGDGIPNFLDADDDGDNVPTSAENHNFNETDGLANAQNTDADTEDSDNQIPDYLDPDDDGDGVLTRNEESISQDQNPGNDMTSDNIADYLNPNVDIDVPATAYREHPIKQKFTITVEVENFALPNLSNIDYQNFGELTPEQTNERTVTPDFE